jgi:hypothetical protein
MAIVPVTPLGTGLTVGDAPSCKPFGPTGAPGTIPSEEVAPSGGVTVPTWANAGLQHDSQAVANINNGLMEDFPEGDGRITQRATASTAVCKAAEAMILFFMMTADRG